MVLHPLRLTWTYLTKAAQSSFTRLVSKPVVDQPGPHRVAFPAFISYLWFLKTIPTIPEERKFHCMVSPTGWRNDSIYQGAGR